MTVELIGGDGGTVELALDNKTLLAVLGGEGELVLSCLI